MEEFIYLFIFYFISTLLSLFQLLYYRYSSLFVQGVESKNKEKIKGHASTETFKRRMEIRLKGESL